MASKIPKEVKKVIGDAYVAEPTWKVALFMSTSNCLTQSLFSSCSNPVVGAGYTAGGATLAGRAATYVDTNNVMIDATDTAWTAATFTARYAVVYETAGSLIRAIYDFVTDKTVTAGTFTIQWNTSGLVRIS